KFWQSATNPRMRARAFWVLVKMPGGEKYIAAAVKDGNPDKKFDYSTMQTAGSNGLFNTYHSVGGTIKKLNYFGFINYRNLDGWRDNSSQQQLTGFGKITYAFNEKVKLGIEYSLLRNKIKMPGGLRMTSLKKTAAPPIVPGTGLKVHGTL
ncbi:MAG: hypothetical protein ABI581_17525, partial [Sediminibacterium sp.]